jgi:hypothetical protein
MMTLFGPFMTLQAQVSRGLALSYTTRPRIGLKPRPRMTSYDHETSTRSTLMKQGTSGVSSLK